MSEKEKKNKKRHGLEKVAAGRKFDAEED